MLTLETYRLIPGKLPLREVVLLGLCQENLLQLGEDGFELLQRGFLRHGC